MKNDNRYNINKEVQLQSNQRNKMKQRVIFILLKFSYYGKCPQKWTVSYWWELKLRKSYCGSQFKYMQPKTQTCICLH